MEIDARVDKELIVLGWQPIHFFPGELQEDYIFLPFIQASAKDFLECGCR